MEVWEALMALAVCMTVLSIPIFAIINRRNSPLGEALGARLGGHAKRDEITGLKQKILELESTVVSQQYELKSMEKDIAFLSRLLEDKRPEEKR